MYMHTPVLLPQVVENLKVIPGEKYVDATAGEGGFVSEIVQRGGKVLCIDADPDQVRGLTRKFSAEVKNGTICVVRTNFIRLEQEAKKKGFFPAKAVLFDLGLSMRQIFDSGRGFSYRNKAEKLDMRINPDDFPDASAIVRTYGETQLYDIFSRYGEEPKSKEIAKRIVDIRKRHNAGTVGGFIEMTGVKDNRILARIFQSLRIEVNREMENLKIGLDNARNLITPDGRILVITFHSLEDRIVKQWIVKNKMKMAIRRPMLSDRGKRFERSAKLRIISF